MIVLEGQSELPEMVLTTTAIGHFTSFLNRRKQKLNKNCENGDDDQEFEESGEGAENMSAIASASSLAPREANSGRFHVGIKTSNLRLGIAAEFPNGLRM